MNSLIASSQEIGAYDDLAYDIFNSQNKDVKQEIQPERWVVKQRAYALGSEQFRVGRAEQRAHKLSIKK